MLSAGSSAEVKTNLDKMKPAVLRSGEAKRVAVARRSVSPEKVKRLLEEAKKKIEEARRELDKIARASATPLSMRERWEKRILDQLKYLDPKGYMCYRNPKMCPLPSDIAFVSPQVLRAVQDKIRQIHSIVSEFRSLEREFHTKLPQRPEMNPVKQLEAFYLALLDVITDFYKTRPEKMVQFLNSAIRDAKITLRLLKQAANKGAREWSKDYCSREGCITASEPVKEGGACVKYELVAMRLPSFYTKWYTSNYGRPPSNIFAVVVPVYGKRCEKGGV